MHKQGSLVLSSQASSGTNKKNKLLLASSSSMSSVMMQDQKFVSVVFDFEYTAEDGKKVFMKEREVLLLINKTNNDWWQERYRSNSLDSILVADLNKRVLLSHNQNNPLPGGVPPTQNGSLGFNRNSSIDVIKEEDARGSAQLPKQISAGALLLQSGANLEKRPTFEGLDKRKSWSVADGSSLQSAISVPAMTILSHNGRRPLSSLSSSGQTKTAEHHRSSSPPNHHHVDLHQLVNGGGKEKSSLVSNEANEKSIRARRSTTNATNTNNEVTGGSGGNSNSNDNNNSNSGAQTGHHYPHGAGSRTDLQLKTTKGLESASIEKFLWGQEFLSRHLAMVILLTPDCRISAYQNTEGLVFPSKGNNDTIDSNRSIDRRKPVPLPRSKIPLPQDKEPSPPPPPQANTSGLVNSVIHGNKTSKKSSVTNEPSKKTSKSKTVSASGSSKSRGEKSVSNANAVGGSLLSEPPQKSSLHARFFSKRSKTDLGSEGLAAYKAKRPSVPGGLGANSGKYPAPRVPTFNRPVPQKRTDVPFASPLFQGVMPNSNHLGAFPGSDTIEPNSNSGPLNSNAVPRVFERRTSDEDNRTGKFKPAPTEKPQFTTFKQGSFKVKSSESNSVTKRFIFSEKRLSKVASESDLIQTLEREALEDKIEPIRLPIKSDLTNLVNENIENMLHHQKSYFVQQEAQKRQDSTQEGSYNKLVIDTSKSEPLQIRTEPLNDLLLRGGGEEPMSEGPDKSCSTSFESSEDSILNGERSLEESVSDFHQSSSPLNTLDSSSDSRTKSPAGTSTTSRSPPSPEPLGLTPIRPVRSFEVLTDWDEYEDVSSGRKFYFNNVTKEKSWKPPRKPKGSSDAGLSAPSSPIPLEFEDAAQKLNFDFDDDQPAKEKVLMKRESDKDENVDNRRKPPRKFEPPPDGYELQTDADTGSSFYVNVFTGVRWFSAEDEKGAVYFYEENGNESCWSLPNVSQSIQDNSKSSTNTTIEVPLEINTKHFRKPLTGSTKRITDNYQANPLDEEGPSDRESPPLAPKPSITKTEMLERKFTLPLSTPSFQIGNVNIVVVKQGPMNKTKLIENGKRTRKNWNHSHVVLTDTFLLFFKDAKTFASMQSGGHTSAKPDHCIDLKGASVGWCTGDKSKRSNVFEVNTVLGVSILMQDDSLQMAAEWYQEIKEIMDRFNRPRKGPVPPVRTAQFHHRNSYDSVGERKSSDASQVSTLQFPANDKRNKNLKVSRTKSLKMKILGSNEELEEGVSPMGLPAGSNGALSAPIPSSANGNSYTFQNAQTKSNIREKLRKFFQKRPTMDDLFKRGIIKNEPVFGSTLRELELSDLGEEGKRPEVVPLFVRKCILEIEKGDFLKTDGVYRQSGNLSHIQKIRLQVDQGNFAILETVDDVHVLTGALKLFFRELKEPLIPWDCVDKLLKASSSTNKKSKLKLMRDTLQAMPRVHRATLKALLTHLLRVTEFKELNRMQIPNLAIVFGPTLMWPPSHAMTQNMALDMMQQNIIVESLLNNLALIF
eukprot:TCALIF_12003-PA protein Name:"Similar to ARHGAP27 Rho GTPase-activating protein 27 (Homo sapiens)" AED:0.35 eAED:0.36 QI:0/0/0/0.33/1/1/9/0/1508